MRAGTHPGFGRLVLEWPAPVAVDSRQVGERLVLRFARPLAADLGAVLGRLGDYLVARVPGADDRELVLQLAPGIGAKVDVHDGRTVVLDLTRIAAASAPVELRMGGHDGYARIVLDWTVPISFATTGAERRWRILFDREARIDAATIGRRFPELVDEARMSGSAGRSELALALKAGVTLRVFELAGARVVVDLYPPAGGRLPPVPVDPARAPAATPAAPAQTAPPAAAPAGTTSAGARAAPSETASAPAARTSAAARPTPSETASAPAASASAGARAAPSAAPPGPRAPQMSAAEDQRGVALEFGWSDPVAAAFVLRGGYLWGVFAAPADRAGAPLRLPRATPVPGYLGPGEPVAASGGAAIRFPLLRPLAAAVERVGARWRVVLAATAPAPRALRVERLPQPARLRIAADEAVHLVRVVDPEVGDRLEFWPLLAPGLGQPRAQRLVDLELLATAQGLAWRAHSDRVQARTVDGALELFAPEGLALSAAPGATLPPEPDRADPLERAAATESVPSDPGPAPADAAQENRLGPPGPQPPGRRSDPSDAEHPFAPAPQLALPDPPDLAGLARADALAGPTGSAPLGLARFAPPGEAARPERRAALQDQIAHAAAAAQPAARLELARWFLAQAMAVEALAVLGMIGEPDAAAAADDPRRIARDDLRTARPRGIAAAAAADPQRLARASLAGAAELLMGRLGAAAAGLEARALDADPEAALWRAALAAARADWPAAARELERSGATLDGYPPRLQLRLGLPAARGAIEAGNDDLAKLVLARLGALELHPRERARLGFLEALAQARRGESERAQEVWRALELGPDEETRIDAAFARVASELAGGRLTPAEAVARLAPARALWRGHRAELGMLDRLAELQQQGGDPAAAIRTWHDVLARFPTAAGAERIAGKLHDSFVGALSADGGATIGAVQAYALDRDFPELLRGDGARGDRLRRELAVELAGLDLIEPAAALLEELIEQRLSGPAKAEAGAALAELRLREPDPAAALAALERSRVEDQLPPALSVQRLLLRARALAAARRPDAALALLDDRPGRDEQLLRAEILWQQRDWPRLAQCLEGLLARREEPAAKLSAEDQELAIRLALAYAGQAEPGALERLRARFAGAIAGQAGEAAFLMATLTPGRPVEPDAVLAVAAEHIARTRDYLDAKPAPR